MRRLWWVVLAGVAVVMSGGVGAQQRPASPPGTAAMQLGSNWVEVSYGRPILRGRVNIFGSGAEYGRALYDGGPIWRAGANLTTMLRSDVPLDIGGRRVPAGEHAVLIELKGPRDWTFVLSAQPYQTKYDPKNTTELWGGFNYTPARDVARAAMKVEDAPFAMEQLTWVFSDATARGATLRVWWDRTMASVPFTIAQ